MFERAHGWNGLLVEPHPFRFAQVVIVETPKVRKFSGAASAEEGLECPNMFGNWHKVNSQHKHYDFQHNLSQASHCKLCLGSFAWHHGWTCSWKLHEQGFHRGEIINFQISTLSSSHWDLSCWNLTIPLLQLELKQCDNCLESLIFFLAWVDSYPIQTSTFYNSAAMSTIDISSVGAKQSHLLL